MNYTPPPSTSSPPPITQQKNNDKTTLVVKRIPPSLTCSSEKLHDFFIKYGALQIRPMESKSMKGMVFLDFENRESAQLAYQQLDKLYIDMARKGLSVEYAIGDRTHHDNNTIIIDRQHQQISTPATSKVSLSTSSSSSSSNPNSLGSASTITNNTTAHVPVATELGLNYASNPHLLYRYPNPTPDILNNMMNAIGTVPRLYTQVLHLMNKMNLPPPFESTAASTPSLLKRKRDELLASDESEIELDDEADEQEQKLQLRRMTAQQKRKHLKK